MEHTLRSCADLVVKCISCDAWGQHETNLRSLCRAGQTGDAPNGAALEVAGPLKASGTIAARRVCRLTEDSCKVFSTT